MRRWSEVLISSDSNMKHAIDKIDKGSLQIALVVDNDRQLLGTITDGDIRRAILKGLSLDHSVINVMNPNPTTLTTGHSRDAIISVMKNKQLRQIPIVNDAGQVVGLEVLDELISIQHRDNWVVLMVGGLGSRLQPLTNDCPKPMLKVGNKPLLETILESFIDFGFHRFFFTVNYKAEMIEEYFGNGSRWGVDIRYLRETKRLGTAGSLGLLPEIPDRPILVMNGDILTKVNYAQLLEFHEEHGAKATMCVREYDFQVPYGVALVDSHQLIDIQEKPIHHYFVNAGVYVLNPEALSLVPKDTFYDMPDLFQMIVNLDKTSSAAAFPIREYWIDIGRASDFERANGEYFEMFG